MTSTMPSRVRVRALASALALACTLLAGCATAPAGSAPAGAADGTAAAAPKPDPWEHWNRKVYGFNEAVDKAVFKPVAEAYRDVLPQIVRTGIGNVLGNIGDVWSTANQFFQGKGQYGFEMGMRVLTNTVFGLGGLLDPATEMKLPRRSEDFGQTLGRWGVSPGPYVVLPFLGPSTLRDTAAFPVDRLAAPGSLPSQETARYAVTALELVNVRADLLGTTQLLDQVALDRYSFIRDAYLARRADQVADGAAPMEKFEDEPADAPAEPTKKPAAPTSASRPASAPASSPASSPAK